MRRIRVTRQPLQQAELLRLVSRLRFWCFLRFSQQHWYLEHVSLYGLAELLLMQGRGWVVHGEVDDAAIPARFAMYLADGLPREESGHGVPSQRDNHLWM